MGILISEMECAVMLEHETIKGRHDRVFILFFISTEGALSLPTMTYDNHSIHPIHKASLIPSKSSSKNILEEGLSQ